MDTRPAVGDGEGFSSLPPPYSGTRRELHDQAKQTGMLFRGTLEFAWEFTQEGEQEGSETSGNRSY